MTRVYVFIHTPSGYSTKAYPNVRRARQEARRAAAFYSQFGSVTVEVFTRGNANVGWFARPKGKWEA